MPINKKWTIEELIDVGNEYSKLKNRQVMFEYAGDIPVFISDLEGNQSKNQLLELLPHPFF